MDAIVQREHQVLTLAPTGKDARATREVLAMPELRRLFVQTWRTFAANSIPWRGQ